MTDEAPKPEPTPQPPSLPSPEVRKARRAERAKLGSGAAGKKPGKMFVTDVVMGTVLITTSVGLVLAVALPGMLSSTRGARYSVRIEWERRAAEIDAIAEQARKDGKLPPLPEAKPRE